MEKLKKILENHLSFTTERNWNQFQTPKNLSMALSVEASELAEIFMWLKESQSLSLDPLRLQQAKEEIADIYIYLVRIAHSLGIDINEAAEEKMQKNIAKYPVEKSLTIAAELNSACPPRD
ncbi:MAG: nucleotide pyrophosphohydrolase [Chlamydiae bacterium]|nr:nucleotide pyrophosphohydrolase [Chlamydiota bacterium]